MPYVQLEEPFAALRESGITKRLVFSGWNATPAAVASLISYEVDRHLMGGRGLENDPVAIRNATRRLALRFDQPRPSQTAIALFWPQPELAELCDPLVLARSSRQPLSSTAATADAESLIAEKVKGNGGEVRCIGSRARPALATPAAARRTQPPGRRRFRSTTTPTSGAGTEPWRRRSSSNDGRRLRRTWSARVATWRPWRSSPRATRLGGRSAGSLVRATPSPWKADGELR